MNYTGKELDELLARHRATEREGMLIGLMLAALSGALVGFAFGWLANGWLN